MVPWVRIPPSPFFKIYSKLTKAPPKRRKKAKAAGFGGVAPATGEKESLPLRFYKPCSSQTLPSPARSFLFLYICNLELIIPKYTCRMESRAGFTYVTKSKTGHF